MLENETMCLIFMVDDLFFLFCRARFHPKSWIKIAERFITANMAKRKKKIFGDHLRIQRSDVLYA